MPDASVDVVVIDLAKHAAAVMAIRGAYPSARLIGFAPHVDEASTNANAVEMGVDEAMPRSRFFRDPRAVLTGL